MYVKIQRQTPLTLLLTVEIESNCQIYIYIYKHEVGCTNIISSSLFNHFRTRSKRLKFNKMTVQTQTKCYRFSYKTIHIISFNILSF